MISALRLPSSFLFMTPLHCPPLICTMFHDSSFLYHAFPTESYFLSVAIIVLLLINVPSFPRSLSFCLFNLVLLYCFSLFYTRGSHTSLHHPCYLLLLTSFSLSCGIFMCVFFFNQNLHNIELSMEAILNLEFSSAEYIHAAVKKMIRNVQFCKFEDLYPPNNSHATFPMWFLLGNWHYSWPFFQAPHSCF